MRIIIYVFIIVLGIVHMSNGRPSRSLQEKLNKLRRFNQNLNASKRNNETQRFTDAVLRGTYPQKMRERLTFKIEGVLAACKNKRDHARKVCVASLIRRMYPGHFKPGNNKERTSRRKSQRVPDNVSSTTPRTSKSACYYTTSISTSTTKTTVAPSLVRKNYKEGKNSLFAVLITPNGKKKRIFPITQQEEGSSANIVQQTTKEQIICETEELGFDPVIDARYSMMMFDMMCALCQFHNDTECITRYCTAYRTTTSSPT